MKDKRTVPRLLEWDCDRRMCVLVAAIGSAHLFAMTYVYISVAPKPSQKIAKFSTIDAVHVLPAVKKNMTIFNSAKPVRGRNFDLNRYKPSLLSSSPSSHRSDLYAKYLKSHVRPIVVKKGETRVIQSRKFYKNIIKLSYFRRIVRTKERSIMKSTLRVFDGVMKSLKVKYILYAGTLLGSYRHHDIIPWDDDIDVMVPATASKDLYHALQKISSDYALNIMPDFFWKLFSVTAYQIKGFSWCWPFIDIFFYAENTTHIWNISPTYKKRFVFPKNNVFPIRKRPYMGLLLPAPHNTKAVLARTYDISFCQTGSWSHHLEINLKVQMVPCYLLYSAYPFVWRKFVNGGCNETLVHNGRVISYFFEDNTPC